MHTGYDNFWMYQNSRHEPVLNLPKNDNNSQAILTDSYKQVQNGGRPSQMNSYISPQNNVASSHQNHQHRTSESDCLWPSSVCSMPLKFPCFKNAHSQEAFLTQSNNVRYLSSNSQPQNYNYRYLKNFNVNDSQLHKGNNGTNVYNNLGNSVVPKDNKNVNAQSPRIRVKDVFSLSNNTLYYQFLSSSSQQAHQKKQQEFAQNYPMVNYTRACTYETQSEIINHLENNVPQPPHTYCGQKTATEQLPQYIQNSGSFYQQFAEYSPESQFQFLPGGPVKQNLQLEASKANPLLHSPGNGQEPKVQSNRNQSDSVYGNARLNVIPERHSVPVNNLEATKNSGCRSSLEVNPGLIHETPNLNNITQIQKQVNFTRLNEILSGGSSAAARSSNELKNITSNRKSSSYEQTNGQKDAIVKMSFLNNCQSISQSLTDFNNTDKNSNVSLPSLLESNDKFFSALKNKSNNAGQNEITNMSVPQISQGNFSNSQATPSVRTSAISAQNYEPPSEKKLCPKEPLSDLKVENLTDFLNSNQTCETAPENLSSMNDGSESISTEAMVQDNPLNVVTVKQENTNASMDSSSPADHISEGKMLYEIIKTEEDIVDENPEHSTMEEFEARLSENSDALTETFKFEDKESFGSNEVYINEFEFHSPSSGAKDTENCEGEAEERVKTFNTSLVTEEEIQRVEAEAMEAVAPKNSYKSKINRYKLDMLIKFLEKDEAEIKPPCKKQFGNHKNRKKEVDVNHNRRKLSKDCVVKNKNNSREMISYKTARVEVPKCSSEPSETLKQSTSSGKIQDSKYSSAEDLNRFRKERLRDIPSKPEKYCKIQEEQNFVCIMRALQNLQTHFCMNCGFVSPIDSFWVNVASGELRCCNCFSKTATKGGHNVSKSKPGSPRSFRDHMTDESVGLTKVEYANLNSINTRETIRHEVMSEERLFGEKSTRKDVMESSPIFRKRRVSTENGTKKRRSSEDEKKITAQQPVKINNSKVLSPILKSKHSEYIPKVEIKEKKVGDSSDQHIKRRDSKDSKSLEEYSKKEGKRESDYSDKYTKKTKDCCIFHKDNCGEPYIKKMAVINELPELAKPKEFSDESKRKSIFSKTSPEKHKKTDLTQLKKRRSSDEDVGPPNKICIIEDSTGSKNKGLGSKRQKDSTEKHRRNSFSKEGDHGKKESKHLIEASDNWKMKDFQEGDAAYQKIKMYGSEKQKASDLNPPRRKSKDELTPSKDTSSDKHRRGSTSKEESKSPKSAFRQLFTVDEKDLKKTEEKEKKHSSGKTQKTSISDNREKVHSLTENGGRKSDITSKPLKESQNNKFRSETQKNKESHEERKEARKHTEGKKDEKKLDKNPKEKEGTHSEKKKHKDRLEGTSDKNQTENNRDGNDKTVEIPFGRKNEIEFSRMKASLLGKIMKNKKSWGLLSDG